MVDIIANKLISKLIQNQVINNEKRECYEYVFITRAEQSITYLLILTAAITNRVFIPTVLFLISFFTIRRSAGGFHFNKFKYCFWGTLGIYMIFLFIGLPLFSHKKGVLISLLVISVIILFSIGAINNPNLDWDCNAYNKAKKITRKSLVFEVVLLLALTFFRANYIYVEFMSFSIILNAILLMLSIILKQGAA